MVRFELLDLGKGSGLGEGQSGGDKKLEFKHEHLCSFWREIIDGSSVTEGTTIMIDLEKPVLKFVR